MRLRILTFLLSAALLAAGEDPFEAPPELKAFAWKHTNGQMGVSNKVQALVRAFFAPPEEGGLGITYDNTYTRTPAEAMRDRKANCLTLTALNVAACQSVDIEANYGESLRISRWRRVGSVVRYERHIVAMVPAGLINAPLIVDFLPEVRRDLHLVKKLEPRRVKALFFSNRAVELMEDNRIEEALASAKQSIEVDPSSGIGWNILGVVQQRQGLEAEAEKSFLKSIATDPKDGAPCGNLEGLMRAQGRLAEAQAYRDRSMEIRKNDPFFNAFLADEAYRDSQWEEAEKRIKQAIRILPRESEFYLIQARISLAQGQRKDAIRALEKARKWALPEMQARYDSKLALLKGLKPT
ncbi:MAG TPA: tetratricopeptide repeat protein [Geothrix sp.]|nr:tetratricopeptide repeat protein [Geothrix sp.]